MQSKSGDLHRWIASVGAFLCMVACGSDTTGPAPLSPATSYWRLALNHHAITLALTAPYDTITLVAVPRTLTGDVVPDSGVTTYTVDDESAFDGSDASISIAPNGVVKALAPATNLMVFASHTIGNVTHIDTTLINVNDITPVPVPQTLQLVPAPGDSTHYSITGGGLVWITAVVTAQNHDTLQNIATVMNTPNFNVANIFPVNGRFYINRNGVGKTTVIGDATVYGVPLRDSIVYTVTPPIIALVAVIPRNQSGTTKVVGAFVPGDDTVSAGAVVVWGNTMTGQSIDVTFDNPTAVQPADSATQKCTLDTYNLKPTTVVGGCIVFPQESSGGNIAAFAPIDTLTGTNGVGIRARRFPTVGAYPYHSSLYGTSGVIHVVQP